MTSKKAAHVSQVSVFSSQPIRSHRLNQQLGQGHSKSCDPELRESGQGH